MRAILSADQQALADTAGKFARTMAANSPAEILAIDAAAGWGELTAIGVMEARLGQDGEGLASAVDLSLFVEALGGVISPLPLIGNLLALELLILAGAPQSLLEAVGTGKMRCGLVLDSALGSLGRVDQAGFIFDGQGADVVVGLGADGAVSSCAIDSAGAGVGADLTRPLFPWHGGAGAVVGRTLDPDEQARWTAFANAMICADIVGVLRSGLHDAVDYARTRIQYGVPIGSFQAVQHMCADMLVEIEGASSAMRYAAWAADELASEDALLAAHVAKAWAAAAGRRTAETLMQVYGGVGQTWEHVAHLRTRRVALDCALFGDDDAHLRAIGNHRLSLLKDA